MATSLRRVLARVATFVLLVLFALVVGVAGCSALYFGGQQVSSVLSSIP